MSAQGGAYVSRNSIEVADRERRAEILRQNKRQIAADVMRGELRSGIVPPADRRAVERLIAFLEVTG